MPKKSEHPSTSKSLMRTTHPARPESGQLRATLSCPPCQRPSGIGPLCNDQTVNHWLWRISFKWPSKLKRTSQRAKTSQYLLWTSALRIASGPSCRDKSWRRKKWKSLTTWPKSGIQHVFCPHSKKRNKSSRCTSSSSKTSEITIKCSFWHKMSLALSQQRRLRPTTLTIWCSRRKSTSNCVKESPPTPSTPNASSRF